MRIMNWLRRRIYRLDRRKTKPHVDMRPEDPMSQKLIERYRPSIESSVSEARVSRRKRPYIYKK